MTYQIYHHLITNHNTNPTAWQAAEATSTDSRIAYEALCEAVLALALTSSGIVALTETLWRFAVQNSDALCVYVNIEPTCAECGGSLSSDLVEAGEVSCLDCQLIRS